MENAVKSIKQDMAGVVQELEAKLPNIIEEIEDLKATQGQRPPQHNATDRSLVKEDLHFALRHYLEDDQSQLSYRTGTRDPSMQVSSFEDGTSYFTSIYRTAQTHVSSEAADIGCFRAPRRHMTLYIDVMGKKKQIQIQPDASIDQLTDVINDKINLPDIELDLLHQERTISGCGAVINQSLPLSKAMIFPNQTIVCLLTHLKPCKQHQVENTDSYHQYPCRSCKHVLQTRCQECPFPVVNRKNWIDFSIESGKVRRKV